jgi:hypothetical protein
MQKVNKVDHKILSNQSGIYKLIIKNHCYIGSSKNLYYRLKRHLCDLRANSHKNPHLQNCFNKYGEDEFIYEIIEICSIDFLIQKEKYHIDLLNPNLNVVKNPINISITEESKKKISETLKDYFSNHKVYNKKWDKIKIFNKDGVFIEELTKEELFLKKYCSTKYQFRVIIGVCAGRKKSYNGFIFQFDYDNKHINKLGSRNLSKKYYYEVIDKNNKKIKLTSNSDIIKFLGENSFDVDESITFTFKQK